MQRHKKTHVCVYLLSAQNTGQKDTAVAESPTSNIEERGLISGGGKASVAASNPHGPHTITWANRHTNANQNIVFLTNRLTGGAIFI